MLLAACSSSTSSSGSGAASGSGTASNAPDTSLLGPANAATGTPLKIGFISDGKSEAVDNSAELIAADAATKYINEHLGGVQGRPLQLVTCETGLTPAGATDCGGQMADAHVPIVLSSTPGLPAQILPPLNAAGIPYFVDAGVDPSVLLPASSFVLTNTLGGLAAPVQVANDAHLTHVAMVVIDVPAAIGPIKSLGQPLFDKAGIAVDYVAIPPGTPEMSPPLQAALSNGAQMFSIIGDTGFCVSALAALASLGFQGTRMINPQCLTPDLAGQVSGGLDNVKVATTESLDASDPEVALYEAVLAKYAPDIKPHDGTNSGAYAVVLAFARAMAGVTGELTPAAVQTGLTAMQSQPQPLLAGQTFRCDHALFPLTPAVCSSGIAIVTLDADGKPKSSAVFDAAPILNGA